VPGRFPFGLQTGWAATACAFRQNKACSLKSQHCKWGGKNGAALLRGAICCWLASATDLPFPSPFRNNAGGVPMAAGRKKMDKTDKKSVLVTRLQAGQESAKKVVANLNEAIKGKNGASGVTEQPQSSRPVEDKSK
jgi:hypothetical protein